MPAVSFVGCDGEVSGRQGESSTAAHTNEGLQRVLEWSLVPQKVRYVELELAHCRPVSASRWSASHTPNYAGGRLEEQSTQESQARANRGGRGG